MKLLSFAFVVSLAMAIALPAAGEDRSALAPAGAAQTAANQESPGRQAMQKAAAADKYLFIHFWKEKNAQTDKTWKTLQTGAAKYADSADIVSLQTTDPAEKAIIDKFNVGKSPMPLILSIAPCGAVTKAFQSSFEEKQLETAFVSPCEALCMKAIQSSKMVFVCVVYEVPADGKAIIPQGVTDFQADEKYAKATEIVTLNAADKKEADFLKELQIDAKSKKPVSVLLAPGALIGTFDSAADKKQIIEKVASSQAGCCPGGKCGPGGCGPKK